MDCNIGIKDFPCPGNIKFNANHQKLHLLLSIAIAIFTSTVLHYTAVPLLKEELEFEWEEEEKEKEEEIEEEEPQQEQHQSFLRNSQKM